MRTSKPFIASILVLILGLGGCETHDLFADFDAPLVEARKRQAQQAREAKRPDPTLLRVGVTANYPPLVFKQGNDIVGVEVDLARRLGAELGKTVELVNMRWETLLDALLDERIDIVMSGMTITKARQVRVDFSRPYMRSGLFALVRRSELPSYDSRRKVIEARGTVGVLPDTTADVFVQKHLTRANRWVVASTGDAVFQLKRGTLDLFIYDAAAVMWLVSENEADLAALKQPLNEEHLGWAVRRTDPSLRAAADRALAGWQRDGTLARIMNQWLPEDFTDWALARP
jgi:ABC-type amino acid transport substrate-binding protein